MNKYQRIAAQTAKDDLRKDYIVGLNMSFREVRNWHMNYFRTRKLSLEGARAYKNYFKDKWF